jgi:hypothetical protein
MHTYLDGRKRWCGLLGWLCIYMSRNDIIFARVLIFCQMCNGGPRYEHSLNCDPFKHLAITGMPISHLSVRVNSSVLRSGPQYYDVVSIRQLNRWCVVDTVGAMDDDLRCKQLPSTFILLPTAQTF